MADQSYMKSFQEDAPRLDPGYMKSFQPDPPDPEVIAHAASESTADRAGRILNLSKAIGFAPQYVRDNFDDVSAAQDKKQFADQLQGRPVLSGWAAQSPDHAAAAKVDAGPLARLEGWFSDIQEAMGVGVADIVGAESMREHMNFLVDTARSQSPQYIEARLREFAAGGRDPREVEAFRQRLANPTPGPFADMALETERDLKAYDRTERSFPEQLARAVPQMVGYGAAEALTGPVGVAALMYSQNKGVLARQIQMAKPDLSPEEINDIAATGSAVSAAAQTVLLGPLLRSLPGVKQGLQRVIGGVLARGAADTGGRIALRGLLSYGQHTLMGAMGMALQHSINSATVEKAATGEVDFGQFTRETATAFAKVLPIAATFAAYGPGRDYLADRGRINAAPLERARLDAQIEQARQVGLTKTAPERAAELFGLMGRGAKVFIDWQAAKKAGGLPPEAVAAAEAAQDAVEVPLGDYLAHMQDQHEALKDDVKLTADGMTMNQARARDKELRGALPDDIAKALLGKQTPDEILGFEQPKTEETAAPPDVREAPNGKVSETVKLFRGAVGRDPSLPGRAGSRFLSPDRKVAEGYASPENSMNAGAAGAGKVSEETLHFENILKADTLDAVKEKLGFEAGKPVGSEEVLNRAREKGHDAISYKTKELGPVYVDLMNWLHEMVKQYGGTVEKWQDRLTPEFVAALKEEGSKGATAPEEHAARTVEAMQLRNIDPSRFERLAKQSDKYIQEAAEKARSGSAAGAKASSPADVARLQTYELARDLNRAKAAKAEAVKAELTKTFENLSKQSSDQKLRGLLSLAGKPLLHLFDALTEGTSASKTKQGWVTAHNDAVEAGAQAFSPEASDYADARMRGSLAEAQQWMTDTARPSLPSERFVEKFLADPKPWDELRPAEARTIADVVKRLTTAAKEENIVRRKDAEATVAEARDEISGELRQNPSKGLPMPSGVPPSFWRRWMVNFNALNAFMLRPKNNMRQKSPALQKWAFDNINDAVYVRDGYLRDVGAPYKAAFEAIPDAVAKRRYETYDLSDRLPTEHLGLEPMKDVPRETLWKLARHRMSKGNMDRVVSANGWDRDVIDHILFEDPATKLTVPEWDYLQSLADVNEKYVWPKLKAHFEKFYGAPPTKTAGVPFKVQLEDGTWKDYAGGYEPLKRDARPGVAPQPEPTKGIAQYWGGDFQVPWTPGSVKERVDNSHYLVNLDWNTSLNTVAQTLHWLAFDQPVRNVAKLLNDPVLAADMNQFMGEGRADAVRGWLKSSATRQAQSIPEGMDIVGRGLVGAQRRLALVGIVSGSARLAIAQASHPAGLMLGGEVNPVHGVPALLSVFKPLTLANGEVRLFPNWNDAITYGKEVQHRADNAYGTLRESWDVAGTPGPLGALKDLALRTGRLYLHAVDRLTTTWAWTAFHNEAVAKGMDAFSPEAVAHADGRTQDVMPVHDVETAAPIFTNKQIGGFLIMHGFKNALYNMRQDALAKSVRDFNLAETPGQYGSAAAQTAGRIGLQLAMFGGFAVMGKFALGWGQQADESKGEWLSRTFMGGQAEDIPFIGGLMEPLAKLMLGGHVTRRDFSTYSNPGVAAVVKAQELLGNLVSEGREDYKKVFDALEAALFLSGVPSRPTRIGGEHLYEMLTGEDYGAEDSDTGGRFFYTDNQWESIKRTLTPDE